jgi:hypothetical protein
MLKYFIIINLTFISLFASDTVKNENKVILNFTKNELLTYAQKVIKENSKTLKNEITQFSASSQDFNYYTNKPKLIVTQDGEKYIEIEFIIATPCQGYLTVFLHENGQIKKSKVKFKPWGTLAPK